MASNPPDACCLQSTFREGDPVGKLEKLYGLSTYIVGEKSAKIIVILTDIYGNRFNNVQLTADEFAKAGFYVLIPDILNGDDAVKGVTDLQEWRKRHTGEITGPIVNNFFKQLHDDPYFGANFIGTVGYCYGAKYAVQQIAESGYASAAAIAHPSYVSIEQIAEIKKPLLISAAETDRVFSAPDRHLTEDKLKEIKAVYQLDLFSGVSHGFSLRGDRSDENIRYASEKVFHDQVYWFRRFTK